MKQRLRSKLTYANVMATIAVFLVLGSGSAVALSGSNTVQSDDLGPGAQVKAPDVAANAVNSADVQDGSLRQADLGVRVRGARQPDSGVGSTCGEGTQYETCARVFFNNPRDQRILLISSGEWFGKGTNGRGQCAFFIGQFGLASRQFGQTTNGGPSPFNFAMNTVTPLPLDKGVYAIQIACRDISAATGMTNEHNVELSVVGIGDG